MAATVSLSQYNPQASGALCSECPCAGLVVVPPERTTLPIPDAIFVGMEPGWEELRALRPFVGPSGRKVEALFKKHGLKRERMHITNAALCRSKKEEDRPAAFKCCAPRLVNEINSFPTSVPVVPLGAPAFQSVWGKKLPISLARGFLWNKDGRDVLPTLHPAFVLRESTQSPLISRDFRRAAKRIKDGKLELQEPTSFTVPRTAKELRHALMSMQGDKLSIDIETSEDPPTLAEMICVGVSDIPPKHIAVIPWAPWVAPVLDPFVGSRTVVTHNGPAFDQIVLKRYGVDVQKWDDTLIAHHVFAAHMRQGLDHVTSFYLDVEPWKIQFGKRAGGEKGSPLSSLDDDDLYFYCLAGGTGVMLADGSSKSIWEIVRRRLPVRVLSVNSAGEIEARQVTGWHRRRVPKQKWVCIRAESAARQHAGLVLTPDHVVYTARGPRKACDVRAGDQIVANETSLSPEEESAVLGTLLGDSVLAVSPVYRERPWRAARMLLAGGHARKSGLTKYKVGALPWLVPVKPTPAGRVKFGGRWYPRDEFIPFTSTAKIQLRRLASWVYSAKWKRRIKSATLDRLGAIGLAWWFMDDGCVQKSKYGDTAVIAAMGFSHEDVRRARAWLQNKFGTTYSTKDRTIRFDREASDKFCAMIAPHIFPKLRYKLPRKFRSVPYVEIRRGTTPVFDRVTSAKAYAPKTASRWDRMVAETRFCLTVAKNHNFFTTSGLVANCSKDVHHTALDWLAMHDDLWKHRKVYEFDKKTAEFCRHMQEQGALVDNDRRRALSVAIKKKEKKLYKRMKKACGGDFAPTKTVDIRRILFKEFKAPVLDRTPKKLLPSTGKKTLAAFASMGSERPYGLFCKDLLEWRGCTKMRVTYLDNLKIEMDERTHPSWRSFGTIGGRLSCRKPNLTNLKRLDKTSTEPETRIREIYVAKDDHTLLSFDASQVEMRVAAYISQDPVFIASCESKDLHLANAKLIWGDIPELDDPKGKGKNYRDLAKNVGFAIAYLATPETVYEFIKAQGEKFKDVKYEIIVKVIEKIRRTFKVYYDFAQENYRFMQKHGFLKIGYVTGRIRWFDRYAAPTDIANAPVQTTAAEIIMGWLHTIFPRRSKGTNLIAQVHDQGIFEVPNKDVDKMEALIRSVCGEKVLLNNGVGYYQPIDVKRGRRWSDL